MLIAVLAVMTLFASCGKDEAEVIPRRKLAEIYAEMLVTDQWITSTPGVRLIADTSLVYEPILEKYGYDSEDYRKSIDKYMDDPERFARIFRSTGEILEERIEDLKKEQKRLDLLAMLPKIKSDFKVEEFVPYWGGEPYVHYYDSLDVYLDSATRVYKYVSIDRADTIYDRIRMIKPEPADTLAIDTLKADSLKVDSLKVDSLETKIAKPDQARLQKALDTERRRLKQADGRSVKKVNID